MTRAPRDQWITNGGTVHNDRYSPLDQINAGNVDQLKAEWVTHLGSGLAAKYSGEAQPLYEDGTLYVITGADDVFAIDAKTGKKKWSYQPQLGDEIKTVCCGWTSRGVALGEGKVFVGQLDGKLVALDKASGKKDWETQVERWQDGYTITSAPLYYDGKVITGVSGGEYGIRGHVDAYDAGSGKRMWRFYTIPGPGEKGHDSWPRKGNAWKRGGAPVWQTPAVDPELGMLYFATGNTAPDFNGSERKGDNLYANSIVALDVDSGAYRWHFQQVHHDIWDFDSPSPVVLFDAAIQGQQRKGLASPSKTGWVYLLDRTNGKPLIGIDEKPVPQESRQETSKTQPFPKGDPFVAQSIDQKIDGFPDPPNDGKIFTPFWKDPIVAKPGTLGGSNWPPSSHNPNGDLLYVCGVDGPSLYKTSDTDYDPRSIKKGTEYLASEFNSPEGVKPRGTFTAIDLKTNMVAWQKKWKEPCYSGSMTTGGNLVFTGQNDGSLVAYDARAGKQLWKFDTGAGANASATTFEMDGKQYLAFYSAGNSLIGSKHGDGFWLFSLDGTKGPEALKQANGGAGNSSSSGQGLFSDNCATCHGLNGEGGHLGPSLQSTALKDAARVKKQIQNGGGPMPAFKDRLSSKQIDALTEFVTKELATKGGGE